MRGNLPRVKRARFVFAVWYGLLALDLGTWDTMRQTFTQVISLGRDCRVGFQIRRYFGKSHCIASVFDKQITPPETVLEYIRRDFRGMFERDDLVSRGDHVFNSRYSTAHFHEFKTGIDSEYQEARSRHDQLCANVRKAISTREPTLLVANAASALIPAISSLIRGINPRLPFHIVAVEDNLNPTRSGIEAWKGNDELWSSTFAPYRVGGKPLATAAALGKRFVGHLRAGKF